MPLPQQGTHTYNTYGSFGKVFHYRHKEWKIDLNPVQRLAQIPKQLGLKAARKGLFCFYYNDVIE